MSSRREVLGVDILDLRDFAIVSINMVKSDFAKSVDEIQKSLLPFFREQGFKARGRTFNRTTSEELTQVVNFQMGAADPPGTVYIPGLRHNLYGLLTVNLGVFVPEVNRYRGFAKHGAWIQESNCCESNCCIRRRLGALITNNEQDIWWPAKADIKLIAEIRNGLDTNAIQFFKQFSTRKRILTELRTLTDAERYVSDAPRIVLAIMLAERGERDEARKHLVQQAKDRNDPLHTKYIAGLAETLGLGVII